MEKYLRDWPIKIIKKEDKDYPCLLKKIKQPPEKLFVRGKIPEKRIFFSIVGTRRCSDYGKEIAYSIARDLSRAGLVVVSGLAKGIDTFAHKGALEGSSLTVAVLGTGLAEKKIYPQQNLKLAQLILKEGGCLISEYEPETAGSRFTFPQRNRIIAGISVGVLVVEAGEKSGALITAQYAKKEGRKVFAVPGDIYKITSQGTNALIKQGAILTQNAQDILNNLNIKKTFFSQKNPRLKQETGDKTQKLILSVLKKGPQSIDEIIEKTGLPANKVASLLSEMEIEERVMVLGGNTYAIK